MKQLDDTDYTIEGLIALVCIGDEIFYKGRDFWTMVTVEKVDRYNIYFSSLTVRRDQFSLDKNFNLYIHHMNLRKLSLFPSFKL